MNSIYWFLNRKPKTEALRPSGRLLFCLLLIYTPALMSSALVARVDGEVRVRLGGLAVEVPLLAGTLLPRRAEIQLTNGARLWILCPGSDRPRLIDDDNKSEAYCPPGHSDAMRASTDPETPFLLIPNQPVLNEIDWLVWSGPGNAHYRITLNRINADGEEAEKAGWEVEVEGTEAIAIHHYRLPEPYKLPFADEQDGSEFRLLVENIDNSRHSDEAYDLIHSISQGSANNLVEQARELLRKLDLAEDTQLGRLVKAGYLIGKQHRAEAYALLDTSSSYTFRAQAKLLWTRCVNTPGTPADLIVEGYKEALQLAVEDKDPLNAVIACRGLFSPSRELLTSRGKERQAQVMRDPRLSSYCFEFKDSAPN